MSTGSLGRSAMDQGSNVLTLVREGMDVFDSKGDRVGSVRNLYMGAGSEKSLAEGTGAATAPDPRMRDDSLLDDVARAFGADDEDMPEVLRNRLLREGYIQIDTAGLFASDVYATPEHITS